MPVAAAAVTVTLPFVPDLRVTLATPLVVVAEAADNVPVPLVIVKFTVVPLFTLFPALSFTVAFIVVVCVLSAANLLLVLATVTVEGRPDENVTVVVPVLVVVPFVQVAVTVALPLEDVEVRFTLAWPAPPAMAALLALNVPDVVVKFITTPLPILVPPLSFTVAVIALVVAPSAAIVDGEAATVMVLGIAVIRSGVPLFVAPPTVAVIVGVPDAPDLMVTVAVPPLVTTGSLVVVPFGNVPSVVVNVTYNPSFTELRPLSFIVAVIVLVLMPSAGIAAGLALNVIFAESGGPGLKLTVVLALRVP